MRSEGHYCRGCRTGWGYRSLLVVLCLVTGCQTTVSNPKATLSDKTASHRKHMQSLEMMQLQAPSGDTEYHVILENIIWRPGYGQNVREEALNQLWSYDQDRTRLVLRRQLPRMTNWPWLTYVCNWIAENNVTELDPALISSWGRPRAVTPDERDRPEYIALVQMHGQDKVVDLVFELFMESNKRSQRGLRQRCWDLLHRLDERGRLIELAATSDGGGEDVLLLDLHASAKELGMVPYNREEIIWLQKIREPERSWFWDEAVVAVQEVDGPRRGELEMRDLSVVVAAKRHRPDLFDASESQLYAQLAASLEGQRHYSEYHAGIPGSDPSRERLYSHRDEYTWGDMAAIQLAQGALRLGAIRSHLFDYADRDHEDVSTEYGGVIALDEQGRYEVLEYLPRVRQHDLRFNASQEMFDKGYTSLFHFHYHAQRHRNGQHAGPGLGDMNYADNTRANCLVFSFVNEDRLNVDFYRHGRVIVDLGTIRRPGTE